MQIQISWLLQKPADLIYSVCKGRVHPGSAGQGLRSTLVLFAWITVTSEQCRPRSNAAACIIWVVTVYSGLPVCPIRIIMVIWLGSWKVQMGTCINFVTRVSVFYYFCVLQTKTSTVTTNHTPTVSRAPVQRKPRTPQQTPPHPPVSVTPTPEPEKTESRSKWRAFVHLAVLPTSGKKKCQGYPVFPKYWIPDFLL